MGLAEKVTALATAIGADVKTILTKLSLFPTPTGTPTASTFLRGDGAWVAPAGSGSGDMLRSAYDSNNSGVVDNAEALGGVSPSGYARRDQEETFAGRVIAPIVRIDGGSEALQLRGGAADHVYMGFYPDTEQPGIRAGFLGYGDAGSAVMYVANQQGPLVLLSVGDVTVNGLALWHAGNFQPGVPTQSGSVTATVPNSRLEHRQTLAAPGLTPASRVVLSLAPVPDSAENDPELLDVLSLSGQPGTDTLTVTLAFASRTSGPILLNYLAV
ncbi:hypothetical protein [Deinococcus sp. QL22]|uniref:hypothetical protein n=1 Tax=Deinococcus sp. QL22 TaxID=2939437 RepID=UPI00201770A4|nr:hypothetical protein [Deinococcus sp. QL22]UQN10342.1 hypothetical protein M1R55_29770 [Deinococcus sp. QL22]UQN10476.1 hypothetical protein M1R55_29095 [Deinococcus sp. QL22]